MKQMKYWLYLAAKLLLAAGADVHFASRAGALLSGSSASARTVWTAAAVVHPRHAVHFPDSRSLADRSGLVLRHHLGPAPPLPDLPAKADYAGGERFLGEHGDLRPTPNTMDLPATDTALSASKSCRSPGDKRPIGNRMTTISGKS